MPGRLRYLAANLLWVGANLPGAWRFQRALGRCEATQRAVLAGYLARGARTAYGAACGLGGVRSAEEFRERVPLVDHDHLAPWIRRIADGEAGVLTPEPVRLFETTSGSTRAAKWIPYTGGLQAELRRAVAPWIVDVYRRWPGVLAGPAYWSISPVARREEHAASAVPVGFEEDSAYLGGVFQGLVERLLAVPGGVRRLQEMERFREVTSLYLLAQPELRLVSVWHPSFLLLLLDYMEARWSPLLEALARGLELPDLGLRVPAAPARAAALAELEGFDIPRVWPRLTFVSCWGDGHARHGARELRGRLPGVVVQPKGLLATEAFVTVPLQGRHVLAVTSHYFEFLDARGEAHMAWRLEDGAEYSVVVSTGGGLLRYRLRDRVRVDGFLGSTPCLLFLGKEDRVSDLRGEKLAEGFVGGVLAEALEQEGVSAPFAMLAPATGARPPAYVLFLEAGGAPVDGLGARVERGLRANPHYAYARDLGQLGPVTLHPVREGAFERFAARLMDSGQRLGDVKPTPLSVQDGWEGPLA